MASIAKETVRQQFDKIKSDFQNEVDSGKVPDNLMTLFKSLITLFEILIAVFMEKQTKKTSKNSSIPPSQTEPDDSFAPKPKKKKTLSNQVNPSQCRSESITIQTLESDLCKKCDTDLSSQPIESTERRTLIDIRFEKIVHHVDANTKTCPNCDAKNKPSFPKYLAGAKQYGIGIKAFILNLLIVQMAALKRVQTFINGIVDQVISEATMLKYVIVLHHALQQWEDETFMWLLEQNVIHTDETSLRVDKTNHWIHVYASGKVTLKKLHRKRGNEAIHEINLIPQYQGIIVHDCWASYLSHHHCGHALCGSHLLRELTFIVDSNHYQWARHMKRLLKHVCHIVSKRKTKKLTEIEYQKFEKTYRAILKKGIDEMPSIPDKLKNKRGKIAKSDAHNLHERLDKHQCAVMLFAKESEVPFTNNRAERALRMSKVKQKVSGCFRKLVYAEAYCRISSYIQTMTAKGYNPLTAIEMALSGELYRSRG